MKITVLTIEEMAKHLSINKQTLKRWEKKGLPVVRLSESLRRYILEDVEAWIEEINRLADDFS